MKKLFKHTFKGSNILLYELQDNFLRAAFLMEDKPKEGDLFQSYSKRETGFVLTYRIENVISVEDSNSRAGFSQNALIEADVVLLNVKDKWEGLTRELIDNIKVEDSIEDFYK